MRIRVAVILGLVSILSCFAHAAASPPSPPATAEKWSTWELALPGPTTGNPFVDVQFTARFTHAGQTLNVPGFYDGDGIFRLRFMPTETGDWSYETSSNIPALGHLAGHLEVTPPAPINHGPVRVAHTFHFAYADGTPYVPVGTTCYAWVHQPDTLEDETLATLKSSPFNKLRMCVFPKWYAFNKGEPALYPYKGTAPKTWDFERLNPAFFQHLEKRIGDLRDLGIEADVILFHPYDKGHWGFDSMPAPADDLYLRYIVTRLSAYRNVWWSMANEFDFMKAKTDADWDRFFQIVQAADPYGHLRSIHNGARIYNNNQPWVTHASIQCGEAVEDFGRAGLLRDAFHKPVVFDEVKYEGNITQRWGQLSAEEMVHRFWIGTVAGTYVGHGETFTSPNDVLWWSKGGVLKGASPSRIAFLKKIIETGPAEGLDPIDNWQETHLVGKAGSYYLLYFGKEKPTSWQFTLPKKELADGTQLHADIIDTWNMTVTPVEKPFVVKPLDNYFVTASGDARIALPGNSYMALRLMRIASR